MLLGAGLAQDNSRFGVKNKTYNKDVTCTVRLTTSYYHRGDSYVHQRNIRVLKKATTFDLLAEEASMVGVDEALQNILNLNECEDGIYHLVVCNESRDIETGYIDDWSFKLIPV